MDITKILIGIDDSKYAEHAAQYGFNLARKLNADVGLVNIIEPMPTTTVPLNDTTFGLPFEGTADMMSADIIKTQNQAADSILARIAERYGSGLNVTQYTDYGSSGDGIINCAAQIGANLIVVGTHHRSGLDRLLMGSVANNIIKHTHIPVLVVPYEEEGEREETE